MNYLIRKKAEKIIEHFDNKFHLNLRDFLTKQSIRYQLKKSGFKFHFNGIIEISKENKKIIISGKHLVYAIDIKNYFYRYFEILMAQKRSRFRVLDFSKPRLHSYKKLGLSFYFTSLPEDEWEVKEYTHMYKIKKGDVIFDLGSYCGFSVYGFSKLVGKEGKIYAFEPDELNYTYLMKNIKMHQLNNAIPLKQGIWSKTTTLDFFEEGSLGSFLKRMGHYRIKSSKSVKISVWSLGEIYNRLKLDRLDFVKMDIEGAELEAIKGSEDFIRSKKINFAISSHRRDGVMTHEILKEEFKKMGYKYKIKRFHYDTYTSYMLYAYK